MARREYRPARRRTSGLAAGGSTVPNPTSVTSSELTEAASLELQNLADAKGALGVYKDSTVMSLYAHIEE
jgi:hypothetical protein